MQDVPPQLHQAFRWVPWHIADPAVLLGPIVEQIETEQKKQIAALYLDSLTTTLEASLKFVQGVRSIMGGAKK
jgi:hypothetical protein